MDTWPRRYCADRAELVLLRRAAIASQWLGLAVGGFLASRRLVGATAVSLATAPQLVIALALVVWSLWVNLIRAGDLVSERACPASAADPRPHRWLTRSGEISILPVVVTLLVAAACLDAASLLDWAIWLVAAGAAVYAPRLNGIVVQSAGRHVAFPSSDAPSEAPPGVPDRSPPTAGKHSAPLAAEFATEFAAAIDPEIAPEIDPEDEHFLLRVSRSRTADGAEVIHALLAAEFPPGTRSTNLFVPFCPPWETLPEVEVSVADGPPAAAKIVQLLHHGGQIEVRLEQPSTGDERVLVELIASGAA